MDDMYQMDDEIYVQIPSDEENPAYADMMSPPRSKFAKHEHTQLITPSLGETSAALNVMHHMSIATIQSIDLQPECPMITSSPSVTVTATIVNVGGIMLSSQAVVAGPMQARQPVKIKGMTTLLLSCIGIWFL